MQELKGHKSVSRPAGKYTDGRADKRAGAWRGRKGEKKTPSFPLPGNDFLKETLRSIPLESKDAGMISFPEEESRDCLFLCFGNYLSLMGKTLETVKTDNFRADINAACDEFALKINRHANVNIDQHEPGGRLFATLYRKHEAFDSTFGFLPVSAIDRMPEDIAGAFVRFVSYFARSQGIYTPEQHPDFEWALGEEIREMKESEYMEGDVRQFIAVADDYISGHIKEAFDRIKGALTAPHVIVKKCHSLLPLYAGREKKLLDAMIKGVAIMKEGSIMSFDYNPDYNPMDTADDCQVEVDRTFCIIWDMRDPVVEYVSEAINQEFYNTYCPGFVQHMTLEPDTKKLFRPSPYPAIFEDWFCSFIEILEEYGKCK